MGAAILSIRKSRHRSKNMDWGRLSSKVSRMISKINWFQHFSLMYNNVGNSYYGWRNQLFSVCIALWRPTALAKIYNAVGRQRNLGLALSRKFWTLFKIKTDQVLVNLLWLCYTDSDWMSCITCICICYSTLANFIIRHRYKTAPTIKPLY
jgi:hypothetical protein